MTVIVAVCVVVFAAATITAWACLAVDRRERERAAQTRRIIRHLQHHEDQP